jgi:hypothetical protein
VALVLALRRTGVTRYLALWSSDFPHADRLPDRRAAIRPPSLTRRFYSGDPRRPSGREFDAVDEGLGGRVPLRTVAVVAAAALRVVDLDHEGRVARVDA